jgi:hypothetical protein
LIAVCSFRKQTYNPWPISDQSAKRGLTSLHVLVWDLEIEIVMGEWYSSSMSIHIHQGLISAQTQYKHRQTSIPNREELENIVATQQIFSAE